MRFRTIFHVFLLTLSLGLMCATTPSHAGEEHAAKADKAVVAGEQCDDEIIVVDSGDTEEDVMAVMKRDGSHTCRPGVMPAPKFQLAAPVTGGKHCNREDAVNDALAAAGKGNCTGDKDPKCDGGCADGKKCDPFARMLNDSPTVSCAKKFDAECNGKPSYVCTVRVGQYRCGCKCQ